MFWDYIIFFALSSIDEITIEIESLDPAIYFAKELCQHLFANSGVICIFGKLLGSSCRQDGWYMFTSKTFFLLHIYFVFNVLI